MRIACCIVLALGAAQIACVDDSFGTAEAGIVGGTVTPAGKYPGVGALVLGGEGGEYIYGCTGTLIAPDVVLTAAHCVAGLEGIIPGFTLANDVNAHPTVIAGRGVIVHEQYVDVEPKDVLDAYHDVGLLLLAQPIRDVAPVTLIRATQRALLVPALGVEIVGYGRVSDDSFDEGVMRDATTTLIALNASEMQISRGEGAPQNCRGDSGGPGFVDLGEGRQQIGVVSRSHGGDDCQHGGIHTRVDAYLDWIDAKLGGLEPEDAGGDGGCAAASGQGLGAALLMMGLLARRRRAATARPRA